MEWTWGTAFRSCHSGTSLKNWLVGKNHRVDGDERGVQSGEEGKHTSWRQGPTEGGFKVSPEEDKRMPSGHVPAASPTHTYTVTDLTGNTGGGGDGVSHNLLSVPGSLSSPEMPRSLGFYNWRR